MHFFLQIRYLYKQTKIGRKKKKKERIIFKWNLLLSDEDMHSGAGGWESSFALKSQINEHDKLLLLALAYPKWPSGTV